MVTSYPDENARLRAQLLEQQNTLRQMAEYNRLLSQRVAAYASEINRLKALVAKLQRMQFGKSSEKLREKTQRQVREAEERINALQEELAETLGEQHDPALPQPLRQSSARKPLPASIPRETRVLPPQESACPVCGGGLSPHGCDISEQLELISSAFKVIETQRPKLSCCRCDTIVQSTMPSKPIERSYAGPGLLARIVTAKNALRGVALGRKNWLFAGSDAGGERSAILYSLIGTCKLNGVEPERWLRYVLSHIQDWPANRVRDLLPWKTDLTSA
ncbi:transposase domain-containing protein [Serratia liquefaciens]|uniref:Transposase and inactivated derivatives n=1 Tax=Serratia liquefaciens TaxID=614 RepID=A0A515D5K7_SERLI|nr:transposase domain-containing protein [Serratia liquefaciens]QDL35693.1 hypothetical protein EGO53_28270 [Serratia liquefaciens]